MIRRAHHRGDPGIETRNNWTGKYRRDIICFSEKAIRSFFSTILLLIRRSAVNAGAALICRVFHK